MDRDRSKVSYFTTFLREFTTIFTLSILVFSITGKLNIIFNPGIRNTSTIVLPVGDGLPYATIVQIIGFTLIMAAFSMLLFREFITANIPFLWKQLLFFLAALVITSIFAMVFKWFPADNLYAWLSFIPGFSSCIALSIGLSILVMKMEDKKYNKLLENYKRRHKE